MGNILFPAPPKMGTAAFHPSMKKHKQRKKHEKTGAQHMRKKAGIKKLNSCISNRCETFRQSIVVKRQTGPIY
jgi:hypothetical protein